MTDPPSEPDHRDDLERVSRRRISRRNRQVLRELHHRTWELELLVSGAILFLLSQVPGRLDQVYFRLDATVEEWVGVGAFLGYYFLKLMVYTLVLAFALHLFTRAFWVALVGLDSVFPRGIRWGQLRQGPNTERVYRAMLPTVRELIVMADGVASVIFAAAFSVVGGLVAATLSFGIFVSGVLAIAAVLPIELDPDALILTVTVLVVASTLLIQWVDRVAGPRISPRSFPARTIRRCVALSARLTGLEIYGPVQFTLFSRIGWRRASFALVAVSLGLVTFFIGEDLILNRGAVEYAATRLAPAQAGSLGIDPVYYEDYRIDDESGFIEPWVPTIPRETLSSDEAWVRLFIPVRPSVDPRALARLCPDAPFPAAGGLRRRRVRGGAPPDSALPALSQGLECLARLWIVSLDAEPVEAAPVFIRHPDTGLTGVAHYLDTRQLSPGRHLIRVARAPDARPADAEGPPQVHDILFWR